MNKLFDELRQLLSHQSLREVLMAIRGYKVARLCIHESEVLLVVDTLEKAGLWVDIHDKKQLIASDHGKGGWVSGYGIEIPVEADAAGYYHIYASDSPQKTLAAKNAEHSNDFAQFGSLLGYPACCIKFYTDYLQSAEQVQGDFILPMLSRSDDKKAKSPWLNITTQYFDSGLLSFYPCSFYCEHAIKVAKESYEVMRSYSEAWAEKSRRMNNCPVLYTEYEGIYLFEQYEIQGNTILYNANSIESTLPGVISDMLIMGTRIEVISPQEVVIVNGSSVISHLCSKHLAMLVFGEE